MRQTEIPVYDLALKKEMACLNNLIDMSVRLIIYLHIVDKPFKLVEVVLS